MDSFCIHCHRGIFRFFHRIGSRQIYLVLYFIMIPVPSLVGVVFVILKLSGYIDWAWLWVLCPFWIDLILAGLIVALKSSKRHG